MQLASRFASRSPVLRSYYPLSDDQIRAVAPSIFADAPHESRSERYSYIPTATVLQELRGEGFEPFMVCQTPVRQDDRRDYTKHMIRLRHAGQINGREANEIILLNSHDGTSSYQMLAETGQVRAVGVATTPYRPADAQIAYHLANFITLVRSLSIDPIVVRQNWLDAYDYTTDKGAAVLNDYASKNDPFARVGKESVTVQITSVTRASDASFNVRWTEQHFANGAPTGTERWNAVVSIVLQTPRTEERLRKNPLGIYVNGLSWSRELDASEGAKP